MDRRSAAPCAMCLALGAGLGVCSRAASAQIGSEPVEAMLAHRGMTRDAVLKTTPADRGVGLGHGAGYR